MSASLSLDSPSARALAPARPCLAAFWAARAKCLWKNTSEGSTSASPTAASDSGAGAGRPGPSGAAGCISDTPRVPTCMPAKQSLRDRILLTDLQSGRRSEVC